MDRLQEYFENQYIEDNDLRAKVSSVIEVSLETILSSWNEKLGWNYNLADISKISYSTTLMVWFAFNLLQGKCGSIIDSHACGDNYFKDKPIENIKSIDENILDLFYNADIIKPLTSNTYGEDNVFSLLWLLKNVLLDKGADTRKKKEIIIRSCEFIENVIATLKKGDAIKYSKSNSIESGHAFPMLKTIEMYEILKQFLIKNKDFENDESIKGKIYIFDSGISSIKEHIVQKLYYNLGLAEIENSNFDAAEMVFCLEGLLILERDKENVEDKIIHKIFKILEERQQVNIYWRPLIPFVRNDAGMALLPLSVEVTNSLLVICNMLGEKGDKLFEKYFGIFKNYTNWICSRQISVLRKDGKEFLGWCSEHVFKKNEIQLWETSQVLVYLAMFNRLLDKLIANKALRFAGLEKQKIEGEPNYLKKSKENKLFDFYKDIYEFFDETNKEKVYSLLFYGPPGTGKTTVAKEIAKLKKYPLISLSPSNFIADGVDQVENKTKNIFKALYEQKDAVILFDEIDRLIVDRNSKEYNTQGDMFQLMTPSMLVKIKELRDKQNCIFIIATNYGERIDDAIIRPGRIDKQILVCPPGLEFRKHIVSELLCKYFSIDKNLQDKQDIERISKCFALGTFLDIESFVKQYKTIDGLKKDLSNFKPTISTDIYKKRCVECDKDILKKEVLALYYIKYNSEIMANDKLLDENTSSIDMKIKQVIANINLIKEPNVRKGFCDMFNNKNAEINNELFEKLLQNNKVIYVSSPITTGKRLLDMLPAKLSIEERAEIKKENIIKINNAVKEIKKSKKGLIINPASIESLQLDWEQEDFYRFWEYIINNVVDEMILLDGWEYSKGCCKEYYHALRGRKVIILDETFSPVTRDNAIEKINKSWEEYKMKGLSEQYFFETILLDIEKLFEDKND